MNKCMAAQSSSGDIYIMTRTEPALSFYPHVLLHLHLRSGPALIESQV